MRPVTADESCRCTLSFGFPQLQCWHGKFYPFGKTSWVKLGKTGKKGQFYPSVKLGKTYTF